MWCVSHQQHPRRGCAFVREGSCFCQPARNGLFWRNKRRTLGFCQLQSCFSLVGSQQLAVLLFCSSAGVLQTNEPAVMMKKEVAAALEDAPWIHICLVDQKILQSLMGMEVAVLSSAVTRDTFSPRLFSVMTKRRTGLCSRPVACGTGLKR